MSWETVTLGELVSVKHGWPFHSKEYDSDDGIRPIVVAIGNFDYKGGFRFAETTTKTYTGNYPKEYTLDPGDLLVVMTCQTADGEILGLPARVPNNSRTYLHNQRIGLVEIKKPSILNKEFLYHWMRTSMFNRQLFVTASGTKILHTSPSRIEAADISLPPLLEQKAIAEVLGALDDKIAANERLLNARSDLTRALFKSAPRAAGSVPLSSLARFVNGRAYTKNATGTGRVVIRIAELNSGLGASTVYNEIETPDDNLARSGDLLFAWSGSLTVRRWFRDEAIINQHIFKVIPNEGNSYWLVENLLHEKLAEFQAIAADKTTTMGHIQRKHLDEPVRLPQRHWFSENSVLMQSLWDKELAVELENQTLARTRDELLPLLMSGKITVKDAEAIASDAI